MVRTTQGLRSGSSLILVIGSLALLAVLISTFLTFARLSTHAATARTQSVRADILLEGILRQARTVMAKDLAIDQEPFDHPRYDPWLASILTDNSAFFNPTNGAGSRYRYDSRLDMPDNAWNGGTDGTVSGVVVGPTSGGRTPNTTLALATNLAASSWRHQSTFGTFSDPEADGIPNTAFYVDADGDGKADSLLTPITSGGIRYPDGTCAYMAVRIVDNAHLNPNQHSKWPPHYRYDRDMRPNHVWDTTTGRVDWGYLPDSTDPTGTRYVTRPRLPQVAFKNLRNIAMGSFGLLGDSPDAGEPSFFSGTTGWSWDDNNDRMVLSDRLYFAYEPGIDFEARAWAGIPGTGTPIAGAMAWAAPSTALVDRAEITRNRFNIEDDLALRTWSTAGAMSKYAQVYPSVFGTSNVGTGAISNLGRNAGTSDTNAFFERNFMRCVSSVTRERTKRWMTDPRTGRLIQATPFDLRRLLSANDYDAQHRPTANLMEKLNELMVWFRYYRILERNGLNATGTFDVPADQRRAQYLANLCEYIRAPAVPELYPPTAYTFTGVRYPVYGFCRQPFITEILRDAGPDTTAAGTTLTAGATRSNFANVRVAIELYNPFDTAIDLSRYRLGVYSVAGGGVNTAGTSLPTLELGPAQRIPPFGYLVIATDYTGATVPGTATQRTVARLSLDATQTQALQQAGPRLFVQLRARATDDNYILMDCYDGRNRIGGGPYTGGDVLNAGFNDWVAGGLINQPSGLDFRDWDGFGSPNPALVQQIANNAWNNNTGQDVVYQSRRSGVYRPMTAPWSGSRTYPWAGNADYWNPASATATNLWMALGSRAGSSTPLWNAASPETPGTQNWHQQMLIKTTPPVMSGAANFIFGTRIMLPNRGVDPLAGTNFFNLAELSLVLTVGNGVRASQVLDSTNSRSEYCATQYIAAASEYSRLRPIGAAGAIDPVTLTYNDPIRTPAGFPGDLGYRYDNLLVWVNFERQFRFDIYEGCSMLPSGQPAVNNARILDLLTLYMGNGYPAGTLADFAPYTGPQADTGEDFIAPNRAALSKAAYREGRININTAPFLVTRCLPYPYDGRSDVVVSPPPSGWYSDGATAGLNVYFSESLSGDNPSVGTGYLNTPIPGINKDPYFREVSDIYLFAQAANPRLFSNFYQRAGLGWDCLMVTGCGGWIHSFYSGAFGISAGSPYKHPEYKSVPHAFGYQYPVNKKIAYPNGPHDFPECGVAANLGQRDAMWGTMTNTLSTRSDVFTVYILVKLIRPTPGIVQPTTNAEYEDLGESRLVAIVDRSNCQIFTDPASPFYGQINLQQLPRVLGQMLMENP